MIEDEQFIKVKLLMVVVILQTQASILLVWIKFKHENFTDIL